MKRTLYLIAAFLIVLCHEAGAQQFTSSNLPIVVLSTAGRGYSLPIDSFWFDMRVNMGIIDNGQGKRNNITDPFNDYNGEILIRVQGSSTVMFPKRSFRISTINALGQQIEAPLLGMPAHDDWVIKALYQDKSFLRDDLSFRLFNQMGHYSSRSKFFELVIDNEYRGVYQLMEKIRRDPFRVNIPKMTPADISGDALTGGYIISLDKFTPGVHKGWYSKYKSQGDFSNFFLFEYPKGDSIAPQQAAYIQGFVDKFEDALMSADYASENGYRKYIDVESFIDLFILNELSRNIDGYRASTFMHKHRQSFPNNKLIAGPVWDYNLGYGNCPDQFGTLPQGWNYPLPYNENYIPFWWKRFMSDSLFVNDLRCRYQELRNNILSESSLFSYIDQMAAHLDEAQQRNYTKYPILTQTVYPNYSTPPGSFAGEIGYLKWWLSSRLAWMDSQLKGPCVEPPKTEEKEVKMVAYPNPFNKHVGITYLTRRNMHAKVELLDMAGSTVLLITDGIKSEGYTYDFADAGMLPTGCYIMRVTLNDQTYYHKVVKTAEN